MKDEIPGDISDVKADAGLTHMFPMCLQISRDIQHYTTLAVSLEAQSLLVLRGFGDFA